MLTFFPWHRPLGSVWDRCVRLPVTLFRSIERSIQYSLPKFVAVGALGVFGFPLYYWVWHYLFPQPYENLGLRLFGSALFVPMMLAKYWPYALRRFLPLYWYAAIVFAMPFFFTFMLIKNNGSVVWLASTLVIVFLMIMLVDWLNLVLMFALGSTAAYLVCYLTGDVFHLPVAYLEQLPIICFAIIAGSAFSYSAEMVRQEKLGAMLVAASNIAHELRTPLLGIKSAAVGLDRYLPILLENHQLARAHGLPIAEIRPAHYTSMLDVLRRIEEEVDHSNTIIDMLLVNTKQAKAEIEGFGRQSMAHCIDQALKRFPFGSPKERERIDWKPLMDFYYVGSEKMMIHVLFNLIKNALHAIAKAGKGNIQIWLTPGDGHNAVHFRDTGSGIPSNVMPHIFERFYSWSKDDKNEPGTGIGLAFCKTIVESFGGQIACHSVLGEYTEFIISLPAENAS